MFAQNSSDALHRAAVVEVSSVASQSGETFESVMRDANARPAVVGNAATPQIVRSAFTEAIPDEEKTTADDSDSNKSPAAYEADADHEEPIIVGHHGPLLQNGRFSTVKKRLGWGCSRSNSEWRRFGRRTRGRRTCPGS